MRTQRRYVDATRESPPPLLEDGSEAAAPPPESVQAVPLFGREAAPEPEETDALVPSSQPVLPSPSDTLLPSSMSVRPRPSTSQLPSSMSSARPSSSLAGEARSGAPHPDEPAAVRQRTERPFRGAETLSRTPQAHEHYWIDATSGDVLFEAEVEKGIVFPEKLPWELKKLFLEGSRAKEEAAIKGSLRPLSEKEATHVETHERDLIINSRWLDVAADHHMEVGIGD
eukprot:3611176-Amphidinium_carterae.1